MGDWLTAVLAAAHEWSDPEHDARAEAVARTLREGNRFTEEALAFAINQQMALLTESAVVDWLGTEFVDNPCCVGTIEAGNVPLAGLQDYLAVTGTGHTFLGALSRRSPWLLPAFAEDVHRHGGPRVDFADHEDLVEIVDALIASGSDETVDALQAACTEAEIPSLLRGNRYSIAVLDGRESEDERLGLAEDVLLHEGLGCRNVALVFAPEALDADPYFEAMSVFRGTFPPHRKTSGALKMQQAFLAAVKVPHAYGEGLEYLVSRGEAEVQSPGHLRWVPYRDITEVGDWLRANNQRVQVVSARRAVSSRLNTAASVVELGDAQRPSLDWQPDGRDTLAFLRALGEDA